MRLNILLVSASLLAVSMPMRAQTAAQTAAPTSRAAAAPRRGLLAGFGPFARYSARADATATDGTIEFTAGLSELTVQSRVLLDDMATIVLRDPSLHVLILRTPDADGAEGALGLQRADATRAYLGARGVAPYRIAIAPLTMPPRAGGGPQTAAQADEIRLTIVSGVLPAQP